MKLKRFIEESTEEQFDIIVVGGGITGAAVAYDAASRGMKVALFEKSDFGGATSAATSKLIHGGLRYLNNLEFGLVRESLRERRILENIAPNIVYPLPFMVPTYTSFKSNKWMLLAGMLLYGILSYDKRFTWDVAKKLPSFKTISLKKTKEIEPNVKTKGLTGSTIYYDCQSESPERLTLAFIKSAVNSGAKVSNYSKVVEFIKDNDGKIQGVVVEDVINNISKKIKSTLVINCGGTWADVILQTATGKKDESSQIKRSEGIHIIVKNIQKEHAIAMLNRKSKHFMLMPWRNHTLIGTTDREYIGTPDTYTVPKDSILDLLEDVNHGYGAEKLTYEDVIFAYGGLRPLVDKQTEGTYTSSRRYEIYDNKTEGVDGLITVEGGKYTTSRNLAKNVMKMVQKKLGINLPSSKTDKNFLFGCDIKNVDEFINKTAKSYPEFSLQTVQTIAKGFGTETEEILNLASTDSTLSNIMSHDGELLAEVAYSIQNEMALTLTDVMFRRTGIGTLGNPGDEIIEKCASLCAKMLNWNDERKAKEIQNVMKVFTLPK